MWFYFGAECNKFCDLWLIDNIQLVAADFMVSVIVLVKLGHCFLLRFYWKLSERWFLFYKIKTVLMYI